MVHYNYKLKVGLQYDARPCVRKCVELENDALLLMLSDAT